MTRSLRAIYEDGVLRPLDQPEGLTEQQVVQITYTTDEIPENTEDPILGVIGLCKSGPKDGADQHDHYIYGSRKR